MGFFETLKHKSAAKKAGLTYEQYLEFLAMAAEKGYSLDDYRMHLKAVDCNMTDEQYREYVREFSTLRPEEYLHFYKARSEGLSVKAYDVYLAEYQQFMSAVQYGDYLKVGQSDMSIEEYIAYLKINPQSNAEALELHITTQKAQKLNMNVPQYREYTAKYSSSLDAEQYLMFCDAHSVGLSLDQFLEYWRNYRTQYTLERFYQYCQAQKENLSLEQYDEWKKDYSSLSAARFRNLLKARKQNMTLEAYEELQYARQLGLTVEQYREKNMADSLGIRVVDLPFYRACKENQENGKNFAIVASGDEVKIANKLRIKKIILAAEMFKTVPCRLFEGCDAFQEIVLPWGIQEIGEYAFSNCSALECISIPGSIKTIPTGVFDGCIALRTIELHSGIESVNITGWTDLPSLKSVVSAPTIKDFIIQDSPERIYTYKDTSGYSFDLKISATTEEQKNAKTVIMEKGYSDIWVNAKLTDFVNAENIIIHCNYVDKVELENCPNVKVIIIDGCTKLYIDHYKNGKIKKISTYTSDISIPENQQHLAFFIVKDHLDEISGGTNCPELRWIHLPAQTRKIKIAAPSITALCTSADEISQSITTILRNPAKIPESAATPMLIRYKYTKQKREFVQHIFAPDVTDDIKKANEIQILDGVDSIPDELFQGCAMSVLKIPASVKSIGKQAFAGCTNLKSVHLESCPNHVGVNAFENSPIETVVGMDSMTARRRLGIFSLKLSGVTELDFSDIKSVIPPMYFQGSDTEEIIIPKRVKEIGSHAFSASPKLRRIVFKGCPEKIEKDAFEGCTAVDTIEWGACKHFHIAGNTGFPNITKMAIPEGITDIPDSCFKNWGIQDITIPQTVVSIGRKAFEDCPISSINGQTGVLKLTENCMVSPEAFSNSSFQKVVFDIAKPGQLVKIAKAVHATEIVVRDTIDIDSLNRILSLPGLVSVSCIKTNKSVKASEVGMRTVPATLRSFEIPRSIKELNFSIFADCKVLTTLSIPETIELVEFEAGLANLSLQEITVPADLYYVVLKDWIKPDTKISLLGEAHPERYEITAVGEDAYLPELGKKNHFLIQKVIIPEQCTSIAEGAFENLVNLRRVELNAPIRSVGARAFCGCRRLDEIKLPDSVDAIGERAFEGCWWLTALDLPLRLRDLGAYAFSKTGLEKIHIPDGIHRLPEGVFKSCYELRGVSGMQNVGYVDQDAFSGSGILDLVFSEEIFSIADAFKDCLSLKRIFIPVNIAKFSVDLTGCTSMQDLYLPQQIDEFSCVTATDNHITAHARRGSAWRKQLNVKTVDYIKNAEYDELIRIELEKVHLQRSITAQFDPPVVQTTESTKKRDVGSTVHRRASWNTKSHTAVTEEVFTSGPVTVGELVEKLQGNAEQVQYVIESTECNSAADLTLLPVATANIYVSEETKIISNNIFTICLKRCEKPYPGELFVVLVDKSGQPVSDMKMVKIAQEQCEAIGVQLQLNAGIQNGEYFLITASQTNIKDAILSVDKCVVDVAFAMDMDFDF